MRIVSLECSLQCSVPSTVCMTLGLQASPTSPFSLSPTLHVQSSLAGLSLSNVVQCSPPPFVPGMNSILPVTPLTLVR